MQLVGGIGESTSEVLGKAGAGAARLALDAQAGSLEQEPEGGVPAPSVAS